ncbi:glycosyltransferase [Rhizobium sp. E27B/91]|uniref:glycosyltransferase n=1 Tax=Rhizobium sp. E27B/91 TaxID=2819995 RepID=UPI001ADB08AA|nr:glycosyltransferase [Rhizobium sp. E27B/91]MBO9186491.1 glycosyltransferase [Rhizobium sp. E27B/91]
MEFYSPVSVSVVVPIYSGQDYVNELIEQLASVRKGWRDRQVPLDLTEVILVDDSAIDGSPALIDELALAYGWVTAVHLMRNFGQHAATIAGILHSSGDWIVTMDEDLQHSPFEIETLLKAATCSGSDIIYAKPVNKVHEDRARDWSSRGFKRLMVLMTGNANIAHFNSYRLLRGPLARAASSVCGYDTYFDIALSWFSNRVQVLHLDLKDRRFIESGKSGYNFSRLMTHARKLLLSSQVKMLRIFGLLGFAVVLASIFGGLFVLFEKMVTPPREIVIGWSSLMFTILFFGGTITSMVALVLEYLSTLVQAAHGKPIFFVVDRSSDIRLRTYFEAPSK